MKNLIYFQLIIINLKLISTTNNIIDQNFKDCCTEILSCNGSLDTIYRNSRDIFAIFRNTIWKVEKFNRNKYPIIKQNGTSFSRKFSNFTENYGFIESANFNHRNNVTYFTVEKIDKPFIVTESENYWASGSMVNSTVVSK